MKTLAMISLLLLCLAGAAWGEGIYCITDMDRLRQDYNHSAVFSSVCGMDHLERYLHLKDALRRYNDLWCKGFHPRMWKMQPVSLQFIPNKAMIIHKDMWELQQEKGDPK